jgi:diacylglycerol kinase (ATP)
LVINWKNICRVFYKEKERLIQENKTMKFAVIFNPHAGRGKARKIENTLIRCLEKKIGVFEFYRTEFSGHAEQIAGEIKDKFDVIIAAGGDGTIHEIVNGIMGGVAALGIIPIGSGNDFIRSLAIPNQLEKAIEVIFKNNRKKIDIGRINSRYFANGIGVGFDAWVVKESQKVKYLRGFLLYLYAVLKTVLSYKQETIRLSIEGKTEVRHIYLSAFGNGKAMGGGFLLNPEAEIDDGKLDLCIIDPLKKWEAVWHLPKVITGKHLTLPQVQSVRSSKIDIFSENGIALHADGELLGLNLKEIKISILPKALEVITDPDI